MKRLKLRISEIDGIEILTRDQLKLVIGGGEDEPSDTLGNCSSGESCCAFSDTKKSECVKGACPSSAAPSADC